ncbi:hypothetical protein LINPERHAP1_LOCUS42500 [Linum perenne]
MAQSNSLSLKLQFPQYTVKLLFVLQEFFEDLAARSQAVKERLHSFARMSFNGVHLFLVPLDLVLSKTRFEKKLKIQ